MSNPDAEAAKLMCERVLMLNFLDMMSDFLYNSNCRMEEEMSYREKLAWLSLTAMALTFGPYFAFAGRSAEMDKPMPNLHLLWLFAIAAGVQMAIQGIGRLWLRHKEQLEGNLQPPDERDRVIEYRSVRAAYGVLIAGMILVGCVMPFNSSGWRIINTALAMIVAAEVVHYATAVFSYRRYA
jgi:hypothetical protein